MTEYNLQSYIDELVSRIDSAKVIPKRTLQVGDWKPVESRCHDNVKKLCELDKSYKQIYGWLYSNTSEFGFIIFMFHSIAQNQDGEFVDITPSTARYDYPFLTSNIPDFAYEELMEMYKEEQQIRVGIVNT